MYAVAWTAVDEQRYDWTVPPFRKKRTTLRSTFVAMLFLLLIVPHAAVANPLPQQRHPFEQPLSRDVRCVLAVDPPPWKPDHPASVYIRLENRTDTALDLKIVPELYLRNFQEGTYYSLADIVQNKALEPTAKGEVEDIVPVNIHLDKNSSSTFRVDAAKTKWGKDISALHWPSLSLATLPQGPYWLRLEFFDSANTLVKSNEVRVMLEKADSEKR
jgi:hypothetical protein